MGKEIYNIINDMAEVLNASQMQKLHQVLVNRLSENSTLDYLQTYGKGDKERKAYFDAKTKIHLMNYIESRTDNNSALFVSLNKPHKFRRTMATRAIEKGMPIEQVQKILGHEQIDTTLRYAMVNQNNVKLSHRKYIS